MAKTIVVRRQGAVRRAIQPIIVRAPAVKHHLKRGAKRVASAAFEERHRIVAMAGGLALGLIEKAGIDVPTIPMLGKAGTLGLAAWAVGKWGKSRMASHAATGFLSIAAYEIGKEGHISGPMDGGYVAGGYAAGI